MTTAHEIEREIAEMIRLEGKLIENYLEYAKRYAEKVADHANQLTAELFPGPHTQGVRCLAMLKLQQETPESLKKKLEALKAQVKVSHVMTCRHTLTVYVFGPDHE